MARHFPSSLPPFLVALALNPKILQPSLTWHKCACGGVIAIHTREVNPLWVSKLIAHEVQVRLASAP